MMFCTVPADAQTAHGSHEAGSAVAGTAQDQGILHGDGRMSADGRGGAGHDAVQRSRQDATQRPHDGLQE